MKKTIIITAISLMGLFKTLNAQHEHEFSVYGGGGLSGLNYKTNVSNAILFDDDKFLRMGGIIGIGYGYFFNPQWGLTTGFEFAVYNTKYHLGIFEDKYMAVDIDNVNFDFHSLAQNYKERQRATMLQMPLMVQFQTPAFNVRQFFAAAGVKVGVPIKGKYKSTVDLLNAGYYEFEEYYYYDYFMGFGEYEDIKSKGTWDFNSALFLSAEAGMKWRLNDQFSLYTGAYFDYGLNAIYRTRIEQAPTHFVAYNTANPPDFAVNSVILSSYKQNDVPHLFIDKINPLAAGIKLKLVFGKNSLKQQFPSDVSDAPCFPKPKDVGKEVVIKIEPEPIIEKIIEPIPLQKRVLIYAVDKDENVIFPVTLVVKNLADNKENIEPKEDGKGGYIADLTIGNSYEIDVTKVGYTYSITIFSAQPTETEKVETIYALLEPLIADTKMVFDNITFDTNSAEIHEESYYELGRIVRLMKDNPTLRLEISAHTDDVGADDYNLHLSERRAKSITDYLISQGVPASSLTSKGYGKTKPIVPNTSAENRAKNRRVELMIID